MSALSDLGARKVPAQLATVSKFQAAPPKLLRQGPGLFLHYENATGLRPHYALGKFCKPKTGCGRILAYSPRLGQEKRNEEKDSQIDLLLSDVDMPQMSGPELGETLKKTRPAMHIMLMSGGANGNLLVLNYGWAYIQKPFVAARLVAMVTAVLHSPNRSQAGGQEFDTRKDTRGAH